MGATGVWWPARDIEQWPTTGMEDKYLMHQATPFGIRLWAPCESIITSSTRTEIRTATLTLPTGSPVAVSSDSKAFIETANKIREHKREKENQRLFEEGGRVKLGGITPPLHRE